MSSVNARVSGGGGGGGKQNKCRVQLSKDNMGQMTMVSIVTKSFSPPFAAARGRINTLDLSKSQLSQYPLNYDEQKNRQSLSHLSASMIGESLILSHNSIERISLDSTRFKLLKHLDLTNNLLNQVPECLCSLAQLEILNISYNKIYSVTESIEKLQCLIGLDLSNNQLKNLPREVGKLRNLRRLDVSHNFMTMIPSEISHLQQLTTLKCSWNKLIRLPATLHLMLNLTNLEVHGNPLQCPPMDIAAKGLLHIIKYLLVNSFNGKEFECSTTYSIKNWLDKQQQRTFKSQQSSFTNFDVLNDAQPGAGDAAEDEDEEEEDADEFGKELVRQRNEYTRRRTSAQLLKMQLIRQYSEGELERQKLRDIAKSNHANRLALFEKKRKNAREFVISHGKQWTECNECEKESVRSHSPSISCSQKDGSNRSSIGAECCCSSNDLSTSSSLSSLPNQTEKRKTDKSNNVNCSFTMRRHIQHVRDEFQLLTRLKNVLQTVLEENICADNLSDTLNDGVMLCHFINKLWPRMITTIHLPSPTLPKLPLAKCTRNVESFLAACRKVGATAQHSLSGCSKIDVPDVGCCVQEIIEGKRTTCLARLIINLLSIANCKLEEK